MSDTKTYKVLRPIGFKGDRLEKDVTVELTDEEAQNIGPDVELVGAQTEQIDESTEKSGEDSTSETGAAPSEGGTGEGSFENDKPGADSAADGEEDESVD